MKRLVISVFSIFIIFAVQAKKVDPQTAQKVGLAYFYEHAGQFVSLELKNTSVSSVITESKGNIPLYYIFNLNPKGFVIVAADDNILPVIGYSYESNFDQANMPDGLKYWMSNVKTQIERALADHVAADQKISSLWNYYINSTPENLTVKKSKSIQPLLTSTWNQDTYYNLFCPAATGGPDGKAYAGCVATSMGQIMYYYRYPATGQGSHGGISFSNTTYQWENMLDNLTNYNEAVATLLYHCGKSVDMQYGYDGSSANATDCPYSFMSYFKYNNGCTYESKYLYTETSWSNLLKNNLDSKRPMLYSGGDGFSGGHAWVCDGYDASNNFHMNWGWSGSDNGYFATSNLAAGGYTFNDFQGVVQNIYPPSSSYPNNCSGTRTITGTAGTIEDGSGPNNYTNNNVCMWLIDPAENVTKITLSFINFDTELNYDFVTVYDGSTTSANVLGTFSGSTLPASVTSTGPQMLVRFESDNGNVATGWKASYKSSFPIYCSGITSLTPSSGTINDGSGTENYSYNQLCRWRIEPANAETITLNFTDFNLAGNDYLKIFDQSNNALLDYYTGATIPSSKTYTTSSVLLYFKTDGYQNAPGFTVNYTSTSSSGIEDNGNLSEMNIFPNPANSKLNVQFNLNEPDNISIELCSITGVVLYKELKNNFSGTYKNIINTADLSQGVYLLHIKGDKLSLCKKIIIE